MNILPGTCCLLLAPIALNASSIDKADLFLTHSGFDIIGEAYSLKDQSLLYREYHQINNTDHLVIYRDPQDKEFSRKTLDYSPSDFAPSFKQYNQWSGELISVNNQQHTLELSYTNEEKDIKKTNTKVINASDTLIIDAGFNRYIQQNWQQIIDGEYTPFNYALADRQDIVKLAIEHADCQQPVEKSQTCFSLGVNNRLLRWLIGSLNLVYDKESKQLMRFTGLANINDQDGKGLKVDIQYYYPAQRHDDK